VLVQSFSGTAAQAERAFGVEIQNYRTPGGRVFRSPASAIRLPASLARHVVDVSGLSTQRLMRSIGLTRRANAVPHALNDCATADGVQGSNPGSVQPADLAAASGYDSQTLLNGGFDGSGEAVALLEFSNYLNSDQSSFQNCYGLSVPVTRKKVAGGTTDLSGADEVALDQEVVASQAPGLGHIYTYVGPQSAGQAGIFDAILRQRASTGVRVVSDSWGACEVVLFEAEQAINNFELQLMAVAGMSFYAASGDSGSSDCDRFGIDALEVDDPAVQPYATGVGGTNFSPGPNETAWGGNGPSAGGGGGGVSLSFVRGAYQKGPGVIRTGLSSRKKCGGKTRYCREVPDVAFDADPNTGYVVKVEGIWTVVGGTSAAAPLMAAFTADANEYSRAHGGVRMGFADPFLYHQFAVHPSMFNDVTAGTNNIVGRSVYRAQNGYDMATGLGSIDINSMAQRLAIYTRRKLRVEGTKITASESRGTVTAGHPTVISGKLVDTSIHRALGGRVVWVEGVSRGQPQFFRTHSGRKGNWAIRITRRQLLGAFHWHAVYVGEQGHRPAVTRVHLLRVG
jgi:kumamolisin